MKNHIDKDQARDESVLVKVALLINSIAMLLVLCAFFLIIVVEFPNLFSAEKEMVAVVTEDLDRIENGLDVETGFIAEGDYLLVKRTCISCHSSKLVLQNRATKEGWQDMITWMQATQKLWDLGENEEKIIHYLATYYGPEAKGRRAPLEVDEWYEIE